MRYLDVTLPLSSELTVYPGDPLVRVTVWSSIAQNAEFNVSAIALGSHTGTHVDAPRHCFDGAATVDTLPLDVLCGPAALIDAKPAGEHAEAPLSLPELPEGATRLLLRTRGGAGWDSDSALGGPGLDEHSALRLIRHGVRLVGIDRLSIAAGAATLPVHRLLLEAGVVILEGLDLSHAPPGRYGLLCLPLKLANGDGAPTRVVLTEEN
jgi:arylformamidase